MFSDQNLNQYKIFYTVAECGNISHAAEKLYISQPAISKAISKLEESLDVKLFARNHRGVSLTAEGTVLFDYIKTAFNSIKIGEEKIRMINELDIGQIKIGVSTTLAKYILIPYLKKFTELYPHIKVSIECKSSSQNAKLLDENKIDIALMVKPEYQMKMNFYKTNKIEYIFIATDTYLNNLYLRENMNGLDAKEFEFALFKSANLMLLDEENITRQYVNTYFKENGIEATNMLEVSNMDLLIEFAKIGLGVACVIRDFVKHDLESGKLTEINLVCPIPKKEVGFALSTRIPASNSMEKFIEFINTNPLDD